MSAGAATLAPQRALEIGKPRTGKPAAQQQFMGDRRLLAAAAIEPARRGPFGQKLDTSHGTRACRLSSQPAAECTRRLAPGGAGTGSAINCSASLGSVPKVTRHAPRLGK